MLNFAINNETTKVDGPMPFLTDNFIYKGYDAMAEPRIPNKFRICNVESCDRIVEAKGFCHRHYTQMRKHGKILKHTQYDPNEFIVKGDVAFMRAYNNAGKIKRTVILDAEDVERCSTLKWHCHERYLISDTSNRTHILFHRFILGLLNEDNVKTDHINRNTKDNRKSNLRLCNMSQNSMNRGIGKGNTSGYIGVSRQDNKWAAGIGIDNKRVWIGSFATKEEAALAYNEAAKKYHGEFATLNEIGG